MPTSGQWISSSWTSAVPNTRYLYQQNWDGTFMCLDTESGGWENVTEEQMIERQYAERQPKKDHKNPLLLKELEMDLRDLLFHLVKSEPRIIGAGHFSAESFREGNRHQERDESEYRKMYRIFYRDNAIGVLTCRPHLRLKIVDRYRGGKPHYAMSLLGRLMYELFPGAKIERIK